MMHDLNKGLIYCIQKIKQKPDQNRKISTKLTGLSKTSQIQHNSGAIQPESAWIFAQSSIQ